MDDDEAWQLGEAGRGDVESHYLVFDEGVASEREDLVGELVEHLATLPGVSAVDWCEREVVLIGAPAVPTARLTEAVRRWWGAAWAQRRPWMVAMDRAAGLVLGRTGGRGYTLDGWELTRVVDGEVAHVITLDHGFGRGDGHVVSVTARVRVSLPDVHHVEVSRYTGTLGDDDALGVDLAALDALSTVDDLLALPPEPRLHARLLVARGRVAEAAVLYQADFDRCMPRQRPHLLRLVESLGVPRPRTGTNPDLSVADEATLEAWRAGTGALTERLRQHTGLRLKGSRRSLVELWTWLRTAPGPPPGEPVLPPRFYGMTSRYEAEKAEPSVRVTAELVTAYLGEVVIRYTRGTAWTIASDGDLALVRRGGTRLLSRVYGLLQQAPEDPRRLRRLADEMLVWISDPKHRP
ncbi:hypothetical protein KZZ52_13510 [Dactylosporangium sp. AC04546]|uniref:hypothetical protein n=1 Tax=Dactylosporangium sp. AC04546 TaxID=2862460 RepID=UPI001EDF4B52|nr:hypothetical protein [Dactylosporangium sp. AC04546]WVK86344.1 hypothetical protein KZZ52_13510 [Dactylosporangium sp. AC04546]